MESNQTVNLYVTFVEKEGPFLKIWGQTEKSSAIYVEQFLAGASQHFDVGVGSVAPETLQPGTLVCAKYKDNKYYRARIVNICIQDTFVEVAFVDFGNKDIVSSENIRSIQNFPTSLISIPPLAISFIFAEAHCTGGCDWNDRIFDSISKEIKYREVQCQLLIQATQYFLVKIFVDGADLCAILTQRALMQPISIQAQQAVLLNMSIQKQMIQQQVQQVAPASPAAATSINTYKACTLEPGSQYQVYVSYVNDGPCQFSVQLKQTEDVLAKLMTDINFVALRFLEDLPIPGTICLAKCQEDGSVCRAVVTNEVDNQFKVFYVDFGNYEVVPIDALFQIPFKFVLPKVMAIRYALDGVEKATLTMEMQLAFKNFVDNRLLFMKVLPTATRMAIPKCELWDPETKTSALDVVNRAAVHAYPEPITLTRGFSQPVKVSFVYSCSRFYVQLSSNETELSSLMTELQETCQMYEPLDPTILKDGLPCCALFEGDQLWYRSQVVTVVGESVKVRYIDFGNEEDLHILQLKAIEGEQLTVLRPQAIECCLNGYQNMEDDVERNALLEEIILEGTFTMKVVDMLEKKALVDLYDASNYNVASLLLDRIAAAKSQVSPMLVQAGHKIEHRKSHSQKEWQSNSREQTPRGDREHNAGRENSWNDRSSDRSNDRGGDKSWRQNNRENRSFDSSNEGNEKGSWRQNNKGFSPSHQRSDNREPRQQGSWNNTANEKAEWGDKQTPQAAPAEAWNNTESNTVANHQWSTPPNDTGSGYKNDRRENDYEKRRGGYDRDGRGDRSGGYQRDGGYKKKPDYRGGGSDSGSEEKGYRKGPRTSSRNDRVGGGGGGGNRYERNYDSKPRHSSFDDKSTVEDSWNVSAVSTNPIDAAPASAVYSTSDVVGCEAKVVVSWFHHPGLFYCQLVDSQEQFKTMMEEIQQFYKSRKPELAVVGAPVIGLFPEDNVLYRAQVLQVMGTQYKVYYVDFGNVSTISKVWPIDKSFMTMPAQAIECGLHGVAGASENWGDADSYGAYFDKDGFVCQFVQKEEEKALVNLFHNAEDVAQLLLRDGLAVSTQTALPEIDIPLLYGQQLRVKLISVNNLADIIVVLECGLAVTCSAHNLEAATETFDDTLKGLLQQTVIIYVDNVIEDKLEVTFYDTEGNKQVILEPDEGAYDTVERLCPLPVLRSTVAGYVSFADAAGLSVQPAEYADLLAYLLDQLFETYDGTAPEAPVVPEEGQVYAVLSEDGNWYRGRVASFDDEKAEVCFVDYGNSESVGFGEIRQLDDKFFDVCTLCVQIVVPDAESYLDKDISATIAMGENGWEGTIAILETTAADGGKEEDQEGSGDTGFGTTSLEKPESELAPTESEGSNARLEEAQEVATEAVVDEDVQKSFPMIGQPVFASHVDSPNEFYLQFTESLDAIEELQAQLQEQVPEMPVLEVPATGTICAAPYSVDQQWYRAEILDADDDITTVRFVDFGNTDVIDNNSTQIKTLNSKLLSLAHYASRCSLKVKPKDAEWSSLALEVFERIVQTDHLSAQFLDQDEKTSYVDLYADGVDVRDGLVRENLAVEAARPPATATAYVSHLNSPAEFWVQMENCVDELEWIAEQLSTAESFPELDDLTPGTLCAALFPDDQMWYRARILSNTVAGVELLFVDYGNSSTSDSLRQLPEHLIATAPLAQKCCLQRPEGVPAWTPEACAKFSELSLEGQTVFVLNRIATDETSTVQLLLNGEDVVSLLSPVTEGGYVKEVETLEKMRVKKVSDGEVVEVALEKMAGQEALRAEAVEKFEELNEQGTTLFQIEFVNESTVRLYLNGQDIRPQLGDMQKKSFDHSQSETDTFTKDTEAIKDTRGAESRVDVTLVSDVVEGTVEMSSGVHEIVQDLQTEVFKAIEQSSLSEMNDVQGNIDPDLKQITETINEEPAMLQNLPLCDHVLEHVDLNDSHESDQKEPHIESSKGVLDLVHQKETCMDLPDAVKHDGGVKEKAEILEDESTENPENVTLTSNLDTSDSQLQLEPNKIVVSQESLQLLADSDKKLGSFSSGEESQTKDIFKDDSALTLEVETSEIEHSVIEDQQDSSSQVETETLSKKESDVGRESYQTKEIIKDDDTIADETSHSILDERSKIIDQEKELMQRLQNLSAEGSPRKLQTQKASSTSKSPSPKKTIEKVSPANESPVKMPPKKESSTKASPNKGAPVKISSQKDYSIRASSKKESPVKVPPKKDYSTKGSPKKQSPVKGSPKIQSPVKEAIKSPNKSPVTEETTIVKKDVSPSSVKENSPQKEAASEQDKLAAQVKEVSLNEQTAGMGEQLAVENVTMSNSRALEDNLEVNKDKEEAVCEPLSSSGKTSSGEDNELGAVLEKNAISSRPLSSCSGKMSFDEKIVPSCISRPATPVEVEVALNTTTVESEDTSRTQSSSMPSSGLEHDSEVVTILRREKDEKEKTEDKSRPQSACSGKIKYDDKIVSAVLSGPQAPLEDFLGSSE